MRAASRFVRLFILSVLLTTSSGILVLNVALAHGADEEPGKGRSIELGGQQLVSSSDASEATREPESIPSQPQRPAPETKDSGTREGAANHGQADAKKVRTRQKYKVKYSTSCSLVFSGRDNCYAFTEPPCPNGAPLIQRTVSTLSGRVVARDSYCSNDAEPALPAGSTEDTEAIQAAIQQQREVIVTPERFQKFPILASGIMSQPNGFSLRNGNAHMFAVPNPQTFNVEIFDEPVRVRAIPQSYVWNYGDGQSRRTQNPGKPMPDHTFDQPTDTSHVYTETGDFQIRLNTAYRGEFSVDGGPWIPIPGTANVPSEPMPMSVWRTKKLLVDQNCAEDPDGPACDSPFLKDSSNSK